MDYINESFEDFVNEFAMTPDEKKARRKARRAAKKTGTKLPKSNAKNKGASLTPEALLQAVKDASPSHRIQWHQSGNFFSAETGDRGPRTDHGGGEDGDEWMDDYQQEDEFAPYMKKWTPKAQQMEKDLLKKGITADVGVGWDEKGYIMIDVRIQQ